MDLNALRQAMAPIMNVGKKETFVEVEGVKIYMRPLLPMEEVAVQRYAASVLDKVQSDEGLTEDDQMSRAAALDYFDRFRMEVISYSVVAIGDLSLRGVEYIENGETLQDGTKVRIPKPLAMRKMVEQWSRSMVTICFSKYGDMIRKVAEEAEKMVEKSQSDLEAEIERVEERLKVLKAERETRAAGDPSVTSKQIDNLVRAGKAMENQTRQAAKVAKEEAENEQRQNRARAPVYPPSAPPPTQTSKPQSQPRQEFGSFSDPTVEEADFQPDMLGDLERIAEARRAATVERDLNQNAKPIGSIDGVEAYKFPSVDLSPRGKKSAPNSPPTTDDKDPREGTRNPNFVQR